jgi:hypothetical protein
MLPTDRLLALNNSIGLLVVAALNPDEPDFEHLIREFRLCLNNYEAWAEQFWAAVRAALDGETGGGGRARDFSGHAVPPGGATAAQALVRPR